MAKFLGVISNRFQQPSNDILLEFTDLDLLADFLMHETTNLLYDFQRISEVITQQEINLQENINKVIEIHDYEKLLQLKTLKLEQELEKIECYLHTMDKCLDYLEKLPYNSAACKCSANPERGIILQKLIKFSEMNIEEQIDQIKKEEIWTSNSSPCDLSRNLLLLLDFHQQILQNIEQKSDKIVDQLKHVDGLFKNAQKRSIGACYHKPRHDILYQLCSNN